MILTLARINNNEYDVELSHFLHSSSLTHCNHDHKARNIDYLSVRPRHHVNDSL